MFKRTSILLTFLLLTLLAAPLAAQEGDADADQGESVVILQFETFNTEQEVMDVFYSHLHEAIEQKKGMHVKQGGDATIGDLILTAGCDSATPDCLQGLSDFVDGDKLVFGSVQYSDGVHLITIKMFDFSEGAFVQEITDETIEGEPSEIGEDLKAVIEGFIYGDVGQVAVDISGATEAVVLFDGEKRGMAPTKLDGLPLGQHVVTVRAATGQEKSKTVVLRQGRVSKLSFNFDATGDGDDGGQRVSKGGTSAYEVPGWAAVGIGVGGLVVGILGTSQLNSAVSETDSIICGDPGRLCAGVEPSRAHQLQSDMDSGRTLQVVGFSMAAVGIGVGSYLLYQTYAGGSAETESASNDENNLRFGIAPSKRGVSMGLSVDF
ncbi:MAG: hypothetical protein ACQEVA_13270 [Myxococcota bacterium]